MVNDLSRSGEKNINVESTWKVIDQREVINGKQNCRHNAKYI